MKQFAFGLKTAAAVFGLRDKAKSGSLTAKDVTDAVKSVVEAWDAAFPNEKVPESLLTDALTVIEAAIPQK